MCSLHYLMFLILTIYTESCLTYRDVSNRWILSIEGDISLANKIVKKHGYTVLREIIPGHYLIRESGKRGGQTYGIHKSIASLYEEIEVIQVEKEILKRRSKKDVSFNDPKWKQMWYLNEKFKIESMNVASSWTNSYTGKGIVIGIVDDGVHYDHPDLQPNYIPSLSYDFFDNDNDPKPSLASQRHGTQCAGIAVAAGNNSNCIVGVAYGAKFSALRFMNDIASTAVSEADSLSHETDSIHIYSNSWGVQDSVAFNGPSLVTKGAILQGIQMGRNGLGSIYVFAAGNGGQTDDCNADGYVNSIYTIAISSVAYDYYPAYYVENCAATLASTYSSDELDFNIISTDSQGACSNFSGTSASAAMASAMIALTLEARNNLTWRDVQHVIVHSAKKHALKDNNWSLNGAGLWFSHQIGFGLLDATALIETASSWISVSRQRICKLAKATPNRAVIGSRNIEDVITTDACNGTIRNVKTLEHVQVIVEFSAVAHGQVALWISSPCGTKSKILTVRSQDTNSGSKTWTFTSVNFWDEKAYGSWRISMAIPNNRFNGTLISWTLVLYGTGEDTYDEKPVTTESESPTSDIPTNRITTHMSEKQTSDIPTNRITTDMSGNQSSHILTNTITTHMSEKQTNVNNLTDVTKNITERLLNKDKTSNNNELTIMIVSVCVSSLIIFVAVIVIVLRYNIKCFAQKKSITLEMKQCKNKGTSRI